MKSENVIPDLTWLDEAFSKGVVDDLEAACCLAGYSQYEIRIDGSVTSIYKLYPIDIHHPIVSKIYEIIMTWPNVTRCKPLLWYIEQAVIRSTPYVSYDLLLTKCKENQFRIKECIDNYPMLAEKIGLLNAKHATEEKNSEEIKQPVVDAEHKNNKELSDLGWKKKAKEIYHELGLEKSHLSLEQKSEKIRKEMKSRHDAGQLEMTKRGGKKIPSADSIRRHVLIYL